MSDIAKPGLDVFPAGTSVKAYAQTDWRPGADRAGAPPASATIVETAVVASNGTLTFSSLVAGTRYRLYASVGGQHRYIDFAAGAGPIGVTGARNNPEGALAALLTALATAGLITDSTTAS